MKESLIICECGSAEHQILFRYDEFGEMYMEVHLSTYRNFFKRLWIGLKYAFGYKSKYGNFDIVILGPDQISKLEDLITDFKLFSQINDQDTGNQ